MLYGQLYRGFESLPLRHFTANALKRLDFQAALSDKLALFAPLAQLDRASDYGSEGREFESSAARHFKLRPQHRLSAGAFFLFRATWSLTNLLKVQAIGHCDAERPDINV